MQTKTDLIIAGSGGGIATWLSLGHLDAALALGIGALTILLLCIRIGLAIREWRR
jgi:hypothetical protein